MKRNCEKELTARVVRDGEVKWWMVRRERISVNWNLIGHVRCMVSHLVSVIVLEGVWRVWMFVRWACVWACMCVCGGGDVHSSQNKLFSEVVLGYYEM